MLFVNATLVMHDHLIPDAYLLVEGEKIAGFGKMKDAPADYAGEKIDVKGMNIMPGFMDIHIHAGGPYSILDEPGKAADYMLQHGVTSMLATGSYSSNLQQLLDFVDCYDRDAPSHRNLIGINMEGPYMNVKYGASAHLNPWGGPIDPNQYWQLLNRLGDRVRIWSIAPEREGVLGFILDAKKANPNVIFSAGHSDASAYETEALLPYGLKLATHLSNAMHNYVIYGGCIRPNVIAASCHITDMYAELICDSQGIHVDPYMLRYFRKVKTDERIILISDSTTSRHPNPPEMQHITDLNFDDLGGISGSKLSLDIACRNMMVHTGASLVEVSQFASYNPAKLLGLTDRGEIAVGKLANLVIADDRVNVQKVYLHGDLVADHTKA